VIQSDAGRVVGAPQDLASAGQRTMGELLGNPPGCNKRPADLEDAAPVRLTGAEPAVVVAASIDPPFKPFRQRFPHAYEVTGGFTPKVYCGRRHRIRVLVNC